MAFTGSDLQALRARHKRSVREISAMLGVHRNTWTKFEADSAGEVPLELRLALAAWVRGLPALGDEGPLGLR
jgi:transcriptional regulator with XRE-family HTH domain